MSYGNSSRYLEAEVVGRPREWLVPLMYEHLLSNLRRAAVQIEAGDLEGKAVSFDRAGSIVLELIGSLDHERGGEIAPRLAALYAFFASEIMTVSRSLDRNQLARLIEMIAGLHQAWVEAAMAIAPRPGVAAGRAAGILSA